MVRAYLEFTYLIRHPVQTEDTLARSEAALAEYHQYREFLRETGVRAEDSFSIPRQHAHAHTGRHTWNFGALHGLCTSITENKHIKAVKEPWRRSNRYEALGQMLLTNQRLDKLASARVDFKTRGMLNGSCYAAALLALLTIADSNATTGNNAGDNASDSDCGEDSQANRTSEAPSTQLELELTRIDGPPLEDPEGEPEIQVEGGQEEEVDLGEEDEDEGIVEGPTLEAYVELARRPGKHDNCQCKDDDVLIQILQNDSTRLSTHPRDARCSSWPARPHRPSRLLPCLAIRP